MGPRKKPPLVFNENARTEFLTGFHKRKLERKKKAAEKFEEQLKEAKRLIKANARETYQKYLTGYQPLASSSIPYEEHYELPQHSVKIQEILDDHIVAENNWIGPNKGSAHSEVETSFEKENEDYIEKITDRVPLSSVKEIKKMIGRQSRDIMQSNRAFQKKNRLEKQKSKKRAARKKRNIEIEKKKLKGRKRK